MSGIAPVPPVRFGSVRREAALPIVVGVCLFSAVVASSLSTGGHVSMDSMQQLFEAQTGRSVSWNPPFMSALLGAMGASVESGAGLATALFVAFVAFAFWSSALVVAASSTGSRVSFPALAACIALLLNPVLLLYAGIVWKDVLFAAMTVLSLSLALASLASGSFVVRVGLAVAAAALVGLMPLARQQGWVVGPIIGLLPVLAMAWSAIHGRKRRAVLAVLPVAVALAAHISAADWSADQVADSDGKEMSVGFRSIQRFDLAGIEAYTSDGPLVRLGAPAAALDEVRTNYTPERIDFLGRSPQLAAFLASRDESLASDWRQAIIQHPHAYLTHRANAIAALLGVHRPGACLPVHLGHDGFDHQLNSLGLVRQADVIDRALYQAALPLFGTPIFKHWFYVGIGLFLLAVVIVRRRGRSRIVFLIAGSAIGLFYASFIPTAIACDFRYLFPAIPFLTIVAVALAFGWSEASARKDENS